ncbi:Na+/H+ antiporter NhaC family protein [Acetobacteroides hydrogenigenes]|uniref:Na+/H+ antiporter NhaC n=1 Tax=Acetobacteroides hydrogenigenes TaxID=979970 RepID=A0A4R2ESH8_9BACT|nr:Na+/H+ antiporter NhaC family protein [Acetobacteroides hydrogenigenes]TCN72198.1 Na+/H+ antiporter NhaC [Acetobacteroides hydrogenigenes]
MEYGFLSLLPALVTIVVAFATRKVTWALFLGVVVGSFVVAPSFTAFPKELLHYVLLCFSNFERNMIILFILAVGALLELLRFSGAFEKFAEYIIHYLDKPKKTRVSTFFISLFLFFDDYASILISATSMRSVAAKQRIPKVYLTYLIDNTATIASAAVVSTWAAYEGSLMVDAGKPFGLEISSTEYLVKMIPYNLFIYLLLFFAFISAFSGKWLGKRMKSGAQSRIEEMQNINPKVSHKTFIYPIIMLVILAIVGIIVAGIIALKIKGGGNFTPIDIIGEAPTIEVLLGATLATIIYSSTILFKDKIINIKSFFSSSKSGIMHMLPTALIILWATGLTEVSATLNTGGYIVSLLEPFITASMIPSIVFLMALLISVATGFCWSSMAITMPIAFGMAMGLGGGGEMVYIVSGAVIGGSIAGDLLIPYSDITILGASSMGVSSINHVKSHFKQVMTVIVVSFVGFWALAMSVPATVVLLLSAAILYGIHVIWAKPI